MRRNARYARIARCTLVRIIDPSNIVKLIVLGRLVYHDDDKNNNEDE